MTTSWSEWSGILLEEIASLWKYADALEDQLGRKAELTDEEFRKFRELRNEAERHRARRSPK